MDSLAYSLWMNLTVFMEDLTPQAVKTEATPIYPETPQSASL